MIPSSTIRSWQKRITRFLFHPVDARSAAWLRIAFAITLPWFFWSVGLKPSPQAPEFILWFYQNVIFTPGHKLVVLMLCGSLAFGWRPRLCGFLLCVVFLPLVFLNRGHISRQVMLMALFAFSFMPSGRIRKPWKSEYRQTNLNAGPSWPIRLMQLQLTLVYGANALAKSSEIYLRGEALMDMSISYSNFNVDLSGGLLELGPIVIPVGLAAVASTLMEYLLAFGFWSGKLKWVVAILGVIFHWVLTFFVSIFMLHFASIFLYLTFLLPLIQEKEMEGSLPINGKVS